MSTWVKGDGAKIKITFDKPLTGTVTGNESHFSVTVPEYSYVPGGTLQNVSKAVLSTAAGDADTELVLEMEPLQRFESAAGSIIVAYDGAGTLAGAGGAVLAFSRTFTPSGLVPKPDQNDAEHLEISAVTAVGTLTAIAYHSAKTDEAITIASITASGVLTDVHDI